MTTHSRIAAFLSTSALCLGCISSWKDGFLMTRRIAGILAAFAMMLSLAAFAAPAASAEEATPAQGSVGLCLVIPLGSLVYPICI